MAVEKVVEPIQDHVWPGQEIIEQHRPFAVVVFVSRRVAAVRREHRAHQLRPLDIFAELHERPCFAVAHQGIADAVKPLDAFGDVPVEQFGFPRRHVDPVS